MEIIFTPWTSTGMMPLVHGDQRFGAGAEHDGNVGAVDVSIKQADLVAEFGERQREIYGDGGFANAAFAAGYGQKILHARDRRRDWLLLGWT